MNTDLQVFQFDPSTPLRVGTTPEGVPYVIAADICAIAGNGNVAQALARIDADEKGIISSDTLGGTQNLAYVTESGFYALVLTFRLRKDNPNYERLKRFRKWVTSEVLPSIRKTGAYSTTPPPSAVSVPREPRPWAERLRATFIPHQRWLRTHLPGYWTVASIAETAMLTIEDELCRHGFDPHSSDRPDVSAGRCWAAERRARGLPSPTRSAPLYLPDQHREVQVAAYPDAERPAFEAWFYGHYLRHQLPAYLAEKPSFRPAGELATASVADHACLTLASGPAELTQPVRRQLAAAGGFAPVGKHLPALAGPQHDLFDARRNR